MIKTELLRREVHFHKRSRAPHIVLAIFVVAIAVFPKKRTPPCFGASKVDLARMATHDYADSAYAMWRRNNKDRTCPDSLRELNEYTSRKRIDDIFDPWGSPLRMSCDERGLRVWSLGEDGRSNTSDDVKSWD